jgi:hypothetical protein
MAVGADLDLQVMTYGRPGLERIPAGAGHVDLLIFRMDGGFHINLDSRVRQNRWVLETVFQGSAHRHAGSLEIEGRVP